MQEGRYFCENPACSDPSVVENSSARFKCSHCERVYYCSAMCQKAHWSAHKSDCRDIETFSIFDAFLWDSKCPLGKTVGPHRHPYIVGKTAKQKKQIAFLHNCIRKLPLKFEYHLSCECSTLIHGRNLDELEFTLVTDHRYSFIDLGMRCKNQTCRTKETISPLLKLERPQNVKKLQFYLITPYLDLRKGATSTASNFFVDSVDVDISNLICVRKEDTRFADCECPMKHYIMWVGTKQGTKFTPSQDL